MKTRNKAILTAVCAVLLVVMSVMGTMAYLTDNDTVENTFAVGKVGLNLDEAKVDEYGVAVASGERTEDGNTYKLIPNHTYVKDPTVTVDAGSEQCYVRMVVTVSDLEDAKEAFGTVEVGDKEYLLLQDFVEGWDPEVWVSTKEIREVDNTAVYEFWYNGVVDARNATEDVKLEPLFTTFTVPEGVTNQQLAKLLPVEEDVTTDEKEEEVGFVIDIVAHAMQADGFDTPEDAWDNFPTVD